MLPEFLRNPRNIWDNFAARKLSNWAVLSDFVSFFLSTLWRSINLVGCAAFAVAQLYYPKLTASEAAPNGREFPLSSWWILAGSLFIACFLAWREERGQLRRISLRECFDKCLEVIRSGKAIYPIGMLNEVGTFKLRFNGELEWVCQQLRDNNHGHPFAGLDRWVKPEERLAFLKFAHDRAYDIAYSDFQPAIDAWRIRQGHPKPTGPAPFLMWRSSGKPPEPPWTDILVEPINIESVEVQLTGQFGLLVVIIVNHAKEELRLRRITLFETTGDQKKLIANSDSKALFKNEFEWPCVFAGGERKEFHTLMSVINLASGTGVTGRVFVAEAELDSKRTVTSKPLPLKLSVTQPPFL
jgi:hypothetical protein